jgi:hypothetical protein
MPKKPTDPKIARRFAELVGRGCSQAEAARAVQIGERTGERLLTKPEYRTIMEKARKERAGLAGDVRAVVDAMLTATDSNGQADMALRAKGAELRLRFPTAWEDADDDDLSDALPDGFIVVTPRRPEDVEDVEARRVAVRKCADTLRKALGGEAKATAALDELLNEYVPAYTAVE